MKLKTALALAIAAAAPLSALAQNVTLDFEGATSFASVADFYNGGVGGMNYGISFGGDVLAIVLDGSVSIANAPSGETVFSGVGPEAFMNVASGFAGALKFAYASTDSAAIVTVFSGLGGTGVQLASFNLGANATNGCNTADYCHFDVANLAFAGIARSVNFGASPAVAYDNVNVSLVPEPSGVALMLGGLGALGFAVRRRQQPR